MPRQCYSYGLYIIVLVLLEEGLDQLRDIVRFVVGGNTWVDLLVVLGIDGAQVICNDQIEMLFGQFDTSKIKGVSRSIK